MAERQEEKRREKDLRCQTRCSRIFARGQKARKSKRACKLSCSPAPSKASWTWQGWRSGVSWRIGGRQKTIKKKKSTSKADCRQSQRRDTRNTEGITSVRWPGSSPWLPQRGGGRIKSLVWDSHFLTISLPLILKAIFAVFCDLKLCPRQRL